MSRRLMVEQLASAPWLQAAESRELLRRLEAAGGEARFVGGCVRDALIDPHADLADLDVATTLLPEAVMASVERALPTGIAHGTVTAILGGHSFEITTLRRDTACDGRHAEVAFTRDFKEDAARRDFTINAMSCDGEGRLFDYFGGLADLEAGRLRFVGDPAARIAEDYLRILRFFRFYPRFALLPPDRATLEAIERGRNGIDRLSGERLQSELFRLLAHPGCVDSVRLMQQTGTLGTLLGDADVERLTRLVAQDGPVPQHVAVRRLAALVRGRADPVRIAARLRLSNADAKLLETLCHQKLPAADLDAAGWRALAWRQGKDMAVDILLLAAAEVPSLDPTPVMQLLGRFEPARLPLSGADVMARGVPQGPALGRLLHEVEERWIAADFAPDREACLAMLDAAIVKAKQAGSL